MSPLFAIFGMNMEMLVVLIVALLLFGNRLPTAMRSLGRGVSEFKKGIEGVDDETGKKTEPPKPIDEQPTNV